MAVKGLDRLNRQLRALVPSVVTEMGGALEKEAGGTAQAVARAAPDAKIAASVGHGPKAPSGAMASGKSERGDLLAAFGLHQEVWAGSAEAYWARWSEFGTAPHDIAPKNRKIMAFATTSGQAFARLVHHPGERAQPFFWPTIRARRRGSKSRMARAGNKAAKALVTK